MEHSEDISEVARKVIRSMKDGFSINDALVTCTLSIGIAKARESEDFEDTLRRADISMYKAKKLGKNRIINAD
jgi:diguanylate cyclase (GGDEF)-like protein